MTRQGKRIAANCDERFYPGALFVFIISVRGWLSSLNSGTAPYHVWVGVDDATGAADH